MKKLISLLVVLAMLMAMVPAVFATENTAYQEVTIPEAIELAQEGSETKYLVRGTVTEVANTTYGNLYIEDAEGNSLYVYGVYSVDGVDRYDAMETKPVAGDEVLLLGQLTTYNGNAQMKNAWLQELNGDVLEAPEVAPDPEADTELTIAEAIALGTSKAHNTYTAGKYYVTGEITEIYNTTYGNMYIQDAEGNTLTIYGTFDADGTNRFDAMENQPAVGDTITVYGVIGQYNGTPQMKNGWIQEAAEEEPEAPVEGPLEGNILVAGNNKLAASESTASEYTFTATKAGTLYLTIRNYTCNGIEYGERMLEYKWSQIFVDDVALTAMQTTLEVTEGQVLSIKMTSDYDSYVSNLYLSFEGFYQEPVGSAFNPIELTPDECPVYTPEIAPGEEVYYSLDYEFYDSVLCVYGENAYLIYQGWREDNTWGDIRVDAVDGVLTWSVWQYEICIGNAGDTAATFEIDSYIPLGTEGNPDELVIGENIAQMTSGDWVPYFYSWTAEASGTLTVTVTGDSNWVLNVENLNSGDSYYYFESAGDPNTVSIAVSAGDEVIVMVRLIDAESWEGIEGTLTVVAEFTPAGGGEEEEYELGDVNHDGWIDVEDAMMILQYDAVLIEDADLDLNLADVSGDGYVDVEDAMLVLQYDAMLIEKFPAEEEGGEDAAELPLGNWLEIAAGTYTFTAEEATLLAIAMTEAEWSYTINDVTRTSADEVPVYMTVVEVAAGETVTVVFENLTPASIFTCAGTAESPIEINFVWNEEWTAASINVDMPAGEYVFQMMSGAGMTLTVGGVVTEMTGDGWFDPIKFVVNVAEAGIVPMTLTYPVGTYYNPENLELGYNDAEIDTSGMGYWYTYTAETDTLFALNMVGENWFYSAMIMRADGTYGYPDGHYSSEETVVPMQVLELKAGDVLLLNFGTDDYSAATVEFNTAICAGTAESPIEINFVWNEEWTAASINVDMPAGEYVFQMMSGAGMTLTVGGVVTEMTGDGWFDPIKFVVNVAEAGIVPMTLTYPVGTYYNPENLELGYNDAEIDTSGMGYWYTYTAETDCLFYLNMYGENWFYSAMIMRADGTYGYPDGHYSSEEAVVPMQVLELKAGDILLLNFGTDDYAAATVEFEAYTCAGTEEDPILVQFAYNEAGTAASLNIDLPAGEFVLATRGISYMELAVEGAEFEFVAAMTMRDMDKIFVTVEEAGIVSLEVTYPTGAMFNPEVVEVGEYTAEIEEGNWDGYFYNFVATADGTLTVTVNAEPGWFFVINNLTAGTYGDAQFSDSNENTMTIEVSAGDVIEIVVNIYDPDNGMGVGGTITTALAFTPAE